MPADNLWKTFADFVENFFPQCYPHSYQHRMWKTKSIVENLWKVLKNGDIRFCGKVFKKVKLL
ncbi:hypothetical protein O3935_10385 [Leptotrichia wadei]|uniref:hypothetical protein n=1 Tax=Leptotrichia wadei TaxID=157687 RepID=UPI00352C5DC8